MTTDPEYVRYKGMGLSQCEINKRLQELHDRIIEPNKGHFIPELSPDYNPRTGMLESDNSRPVRMFDIGSSPNKPVATKWIIKD